MKKYAMFIGRWQTWHKGHEWLIRQQLDKGKDIWVAIRNVPTDENNPKSAQQVMMDLVEEPFFKENSHKIQISIIPDIESVNYGRGVGYDVIYHQPPSDIEAISGTAIRKKYIDSNGDEIVYKIDKDDFIRIFNNLISNAIKYNNIGGKIDISLKDNELKISDNGIGIFDEKIKDIYKRYYRATTEQGGFGIGLSIVNHLCNIYKIKIIVESQIDEGTTFTLDF